MPFCMDEWHLIKPNNERVAPSRHSGEGRNPGNEATGGDIWIPAFAGMTVVFT